MFQIQIFTDHNDHIIERYREYKKQRLEKLARTFEERKKKADKIAQRNEFRLKWLLGREGFYEYNKSRLAVMEKEQALTGKNLAARKEAQKNARPVISYDY